ncbi:MAG: hypothetical protein ACFCUJ_06950 [Thiotrichales bacterium]
MIEGISPQQLLTDSFLSGTTAGNMQPPSPAAIEYFERQVSGANAQDRGATGVGSIERGAHSNPPASTTEGASFDVMNRLAGINDEYNGVVDRLRDWPTFRTYMEQHGVLDDSPLAERSAGPRHLSNIEEATGSDLARKATIEDHVREGIERMEKMHQTTQAYYGAGSEYTQDSARWFMNTEFWLTKIKVLTSAVSQAGTAVRTLFTSQ